MPCSQLSPDPIPPEFVPLHSTLGVGARTRAHCPCLTPRAARRTPHAPFPSHLVPLSPPSSRAFRPSSHTHTVVASSTRRTRVRAVDRQRDPKHEICTNICLLTYLLTMVPCMLSCLTATAAGRACVCLDESHSSHRRSLPSPIPVPVPSLFLFLFLFPLFSFLFLLLLLLFCSSMYLLTYPFP